MDLRRLSLYRYIYLILSNPIISYPIISYHIISYHIISYHIISYHIISYIPDVGNCFWIEGLWWAIVHWRHGERTATGGWSPTLLGMRWWTAGNVGRNSGKWSDTPPKTNIDTQKDGLESGKGTIFFLVFPSVTVGDANQNLKQMSLSRGIFSWKNNPFIFTLGFMGWGCIPNDIFTKKISKIYTIRCNNEAAATLCRSTRLRTL